MEKYNVYKYDNRLGFESKVWLGTINANTIDDAEHKVITEVIPCYYNDCHTVYEVKKVK